MKCEGFEILIAQYVEEDLPAGKVRMVERHLAECLDCHDFANGLRLSQNALKSLGHNKVPAAALDRVRTEVMKSVASEPLRRSRHRWRFALVASAGVIVIGAFALWHARESGLLVVPSAKHGAAAMPQKARNHVKGGNTPLHRTEIPGKELAKKLPVLPAPSLPKSLARQALPHPKSAKLAKGENHAGPRSSYEEARVSRQPIPAASESFITGTKTSTVPGLKVKLLTNDPNVVIYLITD
jgi:hypothetical protein